MRYLILFVVLGPVIIYFICSMIDLALKFSKEKRYEKSLNKENLDFMEKELKDCLVENGINQSPSIIDNIIKFGYSIKDRIYILFRDAYTTNDKNSGKKEVHIRKFLSDSQRTFTLAHELTHIIYKPEQLSEEIQGRSPHSIFFKRDENEQIRDYMAAALILPKDEFWNRLCSINYFDATQQQRQEFVCQVALEKSVSTLLVFRRIKELQIIFDN